MDNCFLIDTFKHISWRFYDMIFTSFPEGVLLRKGEPSFLLWESETPDNRQRQLRDEHKSCGNQPAYISMINRR